MDQEVRQHPLRNLGAIEGENLEGVGPIDEQRVLVQPHLERVLQDHVPLLRAATGPDTVQGHRGGRVDHKLGLDRHRLTGELAPAIQDGIHLSSQVVLASRVFAKRSTLECTLLSASRGTSAR